MDRTEIAPDSLAFRPFGLWSQQWLLLTSDDFASARFNCMTVSWGGLGVMWDRPFAMVVVRPQRYTREFLERSDSFTLCAFPEEHRETLMRLGTVSGRDMDKVGASGLTPVASARVAAPSWDEAELVLECRKEYFDDIEPQHFLDARIHSVYKGDYHRVYLGEIVAAWGTPKWSGD